MGDGVPRSVPCDMNMYIIYGAPKGGPMLFAIWLFCGLAIGYNNFFSTAILNLQLLLCINVMVLCAIKIYKNIKLIPYYHSFYGKLFYIFSIPAHNA